MGFLAPTDAPVSGGETAAPKTPDFGDRLGAYFSAKYPIAGSLMNAVAGPSTPTGAQTPPMQHETAHAAPLTAGPDYSSLISQNAQPKEGGGLAAILKMLMGGG